MSHYNIFMKKNKQNFPVPYQNYKCIEAFILIDIQPSGPLDKSYMNKTHNRRPINFALNVIINNHIYSEFRWLKFKLYTIKSLMHNSQEINKTYTISYINKIIAYYYINIYVIE